VVGEPFVTLREAKARATYWARVLNLGNWTITVRRGTKKILNSANMGGDLVGLNLFSPEEEVSDIYLAPGTDEVTLVHELLHLVFDGHTAVQGPYSAMHERALNRTAKALVELAQGQTEE
jgi:hypothetical protein